MIKLYKGKAVPHHQHCNHAGEIFGKAHPINAQHKNPVTQGRHYVTLRVDGILTDIEVYAKLVGLSLKIRQEIRELKHG